MKVALETIKIVEEAIDEAVNKLLNEAAEKILKEDWLLVYLIKCSI
jgi:DNA-binding ferritin-like protein